MVDHPLAALEDADPVPRPPLPGRHVRRTRQRPLRQARGRGGVRDPRVRARRARRARCDRDRAHGRGRRLVRRALGRLARCRAPGARCRRRVHQPGRRAGAAAARARGVLLRRAARHRRRVGEVQHPPLAARLPRLPRVLYGEVLHGAALDETDRGQHRVGPRDDARDARRPRRGDRPADRCRVHRSLRARPMPGARHTWRRGRDPAARAGRGARRSDARRVRHARGRGPPSAGARPSEGQPATTRLRGAASAGPLGARQVTPQASAVRLVADRPRPRAARRGDRRRAARSSIPTSRSTGWPSIR